MPHRSRHDMLKRLAVAACAMAALGLAGPLAAQAFEGGRHGGLDDVGGGGLHIPGGGLNPGGLSGLGGLHGGPGAPVTPGLGDLGQGDHGGLPGPDDHVGRGGLNAVSGRDIPVSTGDDSRHGRDDRGADTGNLLRKDDHGRHGKAAGRVVEDAAAAAEGQAGRAVTQARQALIRQLLHEHPESVEADAFGQPVVRGEILALAPSDAALARARNAGFAVSSTDALPELGLRSVVLVTPRGVSAPEALRRLRALDPRGQYDLNHLYQESGAIGAKAAAPRTPIAAPAARGVRIGLVDGGVAGNVPALAGARIVQRGFAAGAPKPSAHATAVASLLAGRRGTFRGAVPGATLYVADVYGSTPAGGSAEAIARALGWFAQIQAPVVNISLVGPPNLILSAAVKALIARGHLVVAAVGNDGPAAAPLYPASYPGVVAVTGVDARRRLLPEAGRAAHVDFAAPGSDMAAAGLDGGFVAVRGTSFAAPLAAGLLARLAPEPSPATAARALALLGRQAVDAGAPGADPLYGRGVVGQDLRTAPQDVHARLALGGP